MIGFALLFNVLGKIYGVFFGRLENIWMNLKGYFIDSRIKECFWFRALQPVEHTALHTHRQA